jgi:hypothetical protein
MDNEDEDVGARLDRIRAGQEQLCGQQDSEDDDDLSEAPLIDLHAARQLPELSQQGQVSQQGQEESSQEEGPTRTQATIIASAASQQLSQFYQQPLRVPSPVPGAPSQSDPIALLLLEGTCRKDGHH